MRPGSKVTLNVSKGRAPVTVPAVIDISLDDARNQLSALGLKVVVKQQDSDKPKDQVLAQDLADGSGVDKGATITLTVSNGPKAVVVPDVGGRDAAEAQQTLTRLGLQVQVVGGGTVRFQNPPAGSQVPPGTAVVIWCF
jgi:serine/threonine-protein kinase